MRTADMIYLVNATSPSRTSFSPFSSCFTPSSERLAATVTQASRPDSSCFHCRSNKPWMLIEISRPLKFLASFPLSSLRADERATGKKEDKVEGENWGKAGVVLITRRPPCVLVIRPLIITYGRMSRAIHEWTVPSGKTRTEEHDIAIFVAFR